MTDTRIKIPYANTPLPTPAEKA